MPTSTAQPSSPKAWWIVGVVRMESCLHSGAIITTGTALVLFQEFCELAPGQIGHLLVEAAGVALFPSTIIEHGPSALSYFLAAATILAVLLGILWVSRSPRVFTGLPVKTGKAVQTLVAQP